ncbi:MAG: DUF6130 family protein [Fibrobacterota bacterium]|nr:DUF6130 family protein [Fibrobacterota bacterium]
MDMLKTLDKTLVRTMATGVMGLALIMTGCNDDSSTSPPAAAKAEISITEPAEGATLTGSTVNFKISTKNHTVVAPGAKKQNQGHLHYFVDGGEYNALADTVLVLKDLTPGAHKVRFTLQNSDHSDIGIEKTVNFTVKASASTAEITILQPSEGATVGTALTLKISPKNFKVVAPGTNKASEGHLHYFIDGGTYNALADTTVTLSGLAPGAHKVRFTLQNSDHSEIGVEKTVNFVVSATAPSFAIAYPAEGATVGPVVTVKLTGNLMLAAPGTVKAGQGHYHWYLDGGAYNPLVDSAFVLEDLAVGDHVLRVTMNKNDHSEADLEQTVKFKVSPAKPSFAIVSPKANATTGSSVTIAFSPKNMVIGPVGGALKDGEGHFHYYVDGGAYNALADTIFTLNDLAVGEHSVRIEAQDNKHAELNFGRTVKFTVSAAAPSFKITSPAEGDTVTAPLTVKIGTKNFAIVAPGGNKAGEGHLHWFLDKGAYNALADSTFSIPTLSPGAHTIRVTMQNSDHSDGGLEQWINVIVK